MDDNKDPIQLLTPKQILALQSQNSNLIILPSQAEKFKEAKEIIKQRRQDEKKYPILKETDKSLKIFAQKMDFERYKAKYVETLERTSLNAIITRWLNEQDCDNARRSYAQLITDLKRKRISLILITMEVLSQSLM